MIRHSFFGILDYLSSYASEAMCSSALVCDAIDEFNFVNEEYHTYTFSLIQDTTDVKGVQCTVCLEEKKNTMGTSLSRGTVQASRAGSDALR